MEIQMTVLYLVDFFVSTMGILLSISFFTLMERKIMGISHYRKGPSKTLWFGLTQPIADAVKLLSKESMKMSQGKMTMMIMGPVVGMLVMLTSWVWFEFSFLILSNSFKIILTFATMSLGVYSMFLMSWGSNSKYALIGGHRAAAQVMSYEVCLFLVILTSSFMWKSYSNSNVSMIQQGLWLLWVLTPVTLMWVMLCLAETNRTPFDLAEGESEIVSGFNIEYGMGLFALIFISEYGMMMILGFLTSLFFMGGSMMILKVMILSFLFVWTRCSFPRVRYNNLMFLAWKVALPYSIAMLLMILIM